MAERRMFSKSIIDSDAFLDMPLSTQALYFHLSMRADDDGFVNSPKKIARLLGCGDDDAKLLLAKKFIISFDSGVIVIKHWRIHNYIQKDRYKQTNYHDEMGLLAIDKNNGYTLDTESVQAGDTGKDRIGEVSLELGEIRERDTMSDMFREIISYLNLKANTNYKPTTEKTKTLIKARLNEGFTVEDFKVVIDKKVMLWGKDLKMSAYLRPETLFGTKFESYLNEVVTQAKAMVVNGVISEAGAKAMTIGEEWANE